jgi:hypothetical protein
LRYYFVRLIPWSLLDHLQKSGRNELLFSVGCTKTIIILAADIRRQRADKKNIWLYRMSTYKDCGSGLQPRIKTIAAESRSTKSNTTYSFRLTGKFILLGHPFRLRSRQASQAKGKFHSGTSIYVNPADFEISTPHLL